MSIREKITNFITRGKFKGFFDYYPSGKKKQSYHLLEKGWYERYRLYDAWTVEFPEIKSELLTIAGQVMADGVFLESAQSKSKGEYPRAVEAKEWSEDVNRKIGLDVLIHETAYRLAKYGTVFWEKTWTPEYDVRLIPEQQNIEPATQANTGEMLEWRQVNRLTGKEVARWRSEQIIVFTWNEGQFAPYGTSLLDGMDVYLEGMHDLIENVVEYMKKTAWPGNLFSIGDGQFVPTGDEVDSIRTKIKNFSPGDNYVTSFPIDHKVVGPATAEPRMLPDILQFFKTGIIDGLMTVPVSMQNQRSLASAEEMGRQERANLILPFQRLLKRKIEREVYWPYLESEGFSFRVVPSLSFEAPEAHRDEDAEYYTALVNARIITREAAARELGFEPKDVPVDEPELVPPMGNAQDDGQPPNQVMQQQKGKSYVVTEYGASGHDH